MLMVVKTGAGLLEKLTRDGGGCLRFGERGDWMDRELEAS